MPRESRLTIWASVPGPYLYQTPERERRGKPGNGLDCSSQMYMKGHVLACMTNETFNCLREGKRNEISNVPGEVYDSMLPALSK